MACLEAISEPAISNKSAALRSEWYTDGKEGTEVAGEKCVFPFVYMGELQYSCVPTSPPLFEFGWCSVTNNVDVDQRWGTCTPYATVKPETFVEPDFLSVSDASVGTKENPDQSQSNDNLMEMYSTIVDVEAALAELDALKNMQGMMDPTLASQLVVLEQDLLLKKQQLTLQEQQEQLRQQKEVEDARAAALLSEKKETEVNGDAGDSIEDEGKSDCNLECAYEYSPVCGSDGSTYANICQLSIATCYTKGKVYLRSQGKC